MVYINSNYVTILCYHLQSAKTVLYATNCINHRMDDSIRGYINDKLRDAYRFKKEML